MKQQFLLLVCFFFVIYSGQAATIYSTQSGHWNLNSTWLGGVIPTSGDDVIINGHAIIIDDTDGDVTVNSITLADAFSPTATKLTVNGFVDVTVNSFNAYTGVNYQDVEVELGDSVVFTVNLNATFHRTGVANTNAKLQLAMSSKAVLNVMGDFSFQYDDSGLSENNPEILLSDSSAIDVFDDLTIQLSGGNDFTFNVQDKTQLRVRDSLFLAKTGGNNLLLYTDSVATVTIDQSVMMMNSGGTGLLSISAYQSAGTIEIAGSLNLMNSVSDQVIGVILNNNVVLDVEQDILFRGYTEGDAYLMLNDNSRLNLAGSLTRFNAFGSITMSNNSKLVYDGAGIQQIACSDMPGSGADNFACTNIEFNNTSGSAITLEGPWVINRSLELTKGIIRTADTALLIIANGATITGGSSAAYIEGPMVKQGTSSSSTFLFPVGHNGVYAPIEIGAVSDPTYEYQAQYFSCPPPIEDGLVAPLDNISGQGYWSLSKSVGAKDVGVTLHWDDANAAGINNLDSLLIAGLVDNGFTQTWNSLGNNGTTGGIGVGVSGAISSKYSEPPPLDEVTLLTLGSTDEKSNALPVILARFTASASDQAVDLDWMTIMEEDADYFVIERSANGYSFDEIGQVSALGTHNGPQGYDFKDISPLDGANYYRLKQVDYNGNYMYSPIVSAIVKSNLSGIFALPTLVEDQVELRGFERHSGQVRIEIYHQSGSSVYSGLHTIENGMLQLLANHINLSQSGMYHIVIYDGREVKSTQIMKVK